MFVMISGTAAVYVSDPEQAGKGAERGLGNPGTGQNADLTGLLERVAGDNELAAPAASNNVRRRSSLKKKEELEERRRNSGSKKRRKSNEVPEDDDDEEDE